jgi:hypothetical protein
LRNPLPVFVILYGGSQIVRVQMLIFIGLGKLGMSEDVDADTFDQFSLFGGGWLGAVQGRNIVEGRQSCLRLFGSPVFGMDHGGSNGV